MAKYKEFDLVLASFQGYPLWPSVVIKTTKDQKNQARYLVFCYGTHSEHNIAEAHIRNWNEHFKEACTRTDKDVNKAFEEQRLFPDIFKTKSKTYLSLPKKTKVKSSLAPSTPTSAAASTLKEIINETQEELINTKSNLMNDISRVVSDTMKDRRASEIISEDIVNEVYNSISLEYNAKFEKIESTLQRLYKAVNLLENKISIIEDRVDQLEQDTLLDTLIFYGVKPNPNVELMDNLIEVITKIMGLQDFKKMDLLKANRFRMPATQTENVKIAPILVKFSNLDIARKVFAAKSKLVKSGVFVSENLTKKRRDLLNAARSTFGPRSVWSDHGQVLAKVPGETRIRKINYLHECISM